MSSAPRTELCFQPAPSHCAASVGLSPYQCCKRAGWLGREAITSWRLHRLLTPFARLQCPWCPEARGPPWLLSSTGCCFQWGLIALDAVALADPVSHFPLPIVLSCLSHSLSQGHFVAGKLNILMSQCGPMHNAKGQLHAVLL